MFSGRRHLLLLFLLAGAALAPAARASVFATRCVQEAGPISDSLRYSLYVTVPTTGYHFSLVRARRAGDVAKISLRYRLDPGLHGQVVSTHRLRFTLPAMPAAARYSVKVNGGKPSRPRAIELAIAAE